MEWLDSNPHGWLIEVRLSERPTGDCISLPTLNSFFDAPLLANLVVEPLSRCAGRQRTDSP